MSNRTSQAQRYTKRRIKVAESYLAGKTQSEIAREEGVDQKTISNDLKAIRREWQQQYADTFDSIVAEQLVKLDRMEREALDAWERSKKPAVVSTTSGESKSTQVSGRDGNPAFMAIIMNCITQRLKIVGGYASDRDRAERNRSLEQWQTDMIAEIKAGRVTAETMNEWFTHSEIAELFGLAGVAMETKNSP